MKEETRNICMKALDALSEANDTMIKAIETSVKELTDNGKKTILFRNEVDCATCDPIAQLTFDNEDDSVYAGSVNDDEISLDDLTSNELYEITNLLMAGNYELYEG